MHHQLVDQWQNRIFVHWPVGTRNTECQSSWQRKPASWVSTGGDFIVCACELWEVSSYPLRRSTGSNTISVLQSDISCYPLIRFGAHMRTDRHTSLTLCVCVFFFLSNLKNTIYTTQKNNCIIVMLTFLPMGAVVQPLNQCSRSKWGLISGSHIKSRLLIYCHVRAVCHCIFPFIFNYHKAENKMMKVI